MFHGTKSFNGDLSTWKTGNVVKMKSREFFFSFSLILRHSLTTTIFISKHAVFGISSSGDVSGFNGDISKWDTQRVKDMSYSKYTP